MKVAYFALLFSFSMLMCESSNAESDWTVYVQPLMGKSYSWSDGEYVFSTDPQVADIILPHLFGTGGAPSQPVGSADFMLKYSIMHDDVIMSWDRLTISESCSLILPYCDGSISADCADTCSYNPTYYPAECQSYDYQSYTGNFEPDYKIFRVLDGSEQQIAHIQNGVSNTWTKPYVREATKAYFYDDATNIPNGFIGYRLDFISDSSACNNITWLPESVASVRKDDLAWLVPVLGILLN